MVIATITIGCIRLATFTELSFARREPSKQDLIGTWTPDQATLRDMKTRGEYDPAVTTELVLTDNEGFHMVNMPDWFEADLGHSSKRFYSDSGSWKKSKDGEHWFVVLRSSRNLTRFNLSINRERVG